MVEERKTHQGHGNDKEVVQGKWCTQERRTKGVVMVRQSHKRSGEGKEDAQWE